MLLPAKMYLWRREQKSENLKHCDRYVAGVQGRGVAGVIGSRGHKVAGRYKVDIHRGHAGAPRQCACDIRRYITLPYLFTTALFLKSV